MDIKYGRSICKKKQVARLTAPVAKLGKASEEVIGDIGAKNRVPECAGGWAGAFGQITCKAPRAEGATKFWEPGAR